MSSDCSHTLLNDNEAAITDTGDELPTSQEQESIWDRNKWNSYTILGGPIPPVEPSVTMWAEPLQIFPESLHKRLPRWFRLFCYVSACLLWLASNYLLASRGYLAEPKISSSEFQNAEVHQLECGVSSRIWAGRNDECGMDGHLCKGSTTYNYTRPFFFKCPANCKYEGRTFTQLPVGDKVIMRDPYVIGGDPYYRADSFICASAVHAGVVSKKKGGCGVLWFSGDQPSFSSVDSPSGIKSFEFDTEFPGSFYFGSIEKMGRCTGCHDLRAAIIVVNFVFVMAFSYLIKNTTIYLYTLVIIGFWTVILASNPPLPGGSANNNAELISLGFRRLLPCLLSMFLVNEVAVKPQLKKMNAYFSRMVFWGTAFYMGILENYVFGAIPIDRLTVDDLNSQAGAWLSLLAIALIVAAIVIGQSYIIWRAGKLAKYLAFYGVALLVFIILSLWPMQTLRIHHYILALFLLPGTAFKTSASLFYQGLLVGLFVAGVSRWGFDSILQSAHQLLRGSPEDASNVGMATFVEPLVTNVGGSMFDLVLQWDKFSAVIADYRGYSLVINDVERFRGPENHFNLTDWALTHFHPPFAIPVKYYIRLAVASMRNPHKTGPYTRAAVAYLDSGNYTGPLPGMT